MVAMDLCLLYHKNSLQCLANQLLSNSSSHYFPQETLVLSNLALLVDARCYSASRFSFFDSNICSHRLGSGKVLRYKTACLVLVQHIDRIQCHLGFQCGNCEPRPMVGQWLLWLLEFLPQISGGEILFAESSCREQIGLLLLYRPPCCIQVVLNLRIQMGP